MKKGVIFATYSSLIGESQSGGKYKTRLKQLLHWCGDDFDGVVSFATSVFIFFNGTKVNVRRNIWKTEIPRLNKQIAGTSALMITQSPAGQKVGSVLWRRPASQSIVRKMIGGVGSAEYNFPLGTHMESPQGKVEKTTASVPS